MNRRVAITGYGVISPVGNDVPSFWNSITNGKSGIGPVTKFDASKLEARIAAEVKDFDTNPYMERKDARKMALFSQYAVAAAVQAWRDAGFAEPPAAEGEEARRWVGPYDADRIATVLGNGIGGIEIMTESHRKLFDAGPGRMPPMTVPMMIGNEGAANVAMRLGLHGPAYTQVTACASSTDAIGQALDMIRLGRADVVVAGGTEATVSEFAMGGFCRLQALATKFNDNPEKASRPFDADRDGFILGEGAAILILEDWDKAVARGARIHAELAGYGGSCDAYHLTAPDPSGKGGAVAIKNAIADAGIKPEDVGYFNAHGTSTQINDPTETKMLKIAFGDHARKMKISSTKSMTGHMLGAAGAIEALVCVKAVEEGFVPPTINLEHPDVEGGCDLDYVPNKGIAMPVEYAASSSLGFGGHNGVLVIRRAR
ncbi:MAG TPA: beta-ketoacyl-ACP synthase II [Rectinemataceae bacterium]|nr:beta-ketoacyl-ACP synthase II [Rectinemataceae bacterium]